LCRALTATKPGTGERRPAFLHPCVKPHFATNLRTRATLHHYHLDGDAVNAHCEPPRVLLGDQMRFRLSNTCFATLYRGFAAHPAKESDNGKGQSVWHKTAIQDLHTMEQPSPRSDWKMRLVFSAIGFLVAAAGAGGWFYYYARLQDVPPPSPPARAVQAYRPFARIMAAPQAVATPSRATPSEPPSPPSNVPERPVFHILERRHLNDFREELKKTVVSELAPAFPELQTVLKDREEGSSAPSYQRVVFQLLDAARKAPAERRPAILFAADLVASHLGCDKDDKREEAQKDCARLQSDLARYELRLDNDELGGGLYYPHDLLWRIWKDYPETEWGERVFVLLLNSGWDASATCAKGEDQTREVIRQGESFLQKRPSSLYRGIVTLLVAEAYASRWSLSNEPADSGMSDYVDSKEFKEGAEAARIKAIGYFEEVVRLAPGTSLSGLALEILPPLREKQILDNYRFFCVYD
jgi:hypothetical protein